MLTQLPRRYMQMKANPRQIAPPISFAECLRRALWGVR